MSISVSPTVCVTPAFWLGRGRLSCGGACANVATGRRIMAASTRRICPPKVPARRQALRRFVATVAKKRCLAYGGGMKQLVVLALALAGAARASEPGIPFEVHKLANGLTVILSEDHRLPQVAV